MTNLKIYYKNNKLKVVIVGGSNFLTVSMYKYKEENCVCHIFFIELGDFKLGDKMPYYERITKNGSRIVESVSMLRGQVEINEFHDELSFVRTTIILKSGSVYEDRIKYLDGMKLESKFINNEFQEITCLIDENKINEYLSKYNESWKIKG